MLNKLLITSLSNTIAQVIRLSREETKTTTMIGGKPFDVDSLLRECAVKKKRPIHDAIENLDQPQQPLLQQQQATDLSIGKEKIQSGIFKNFEVFSSSFFLIKMFR